MHKSVANRKVVTTFLILVLIQASHSIEEYIGKLWENLPPATVLCGLVSDNLHTGFLIINIGLFVFGLWAWFFPIRRGYFYANAIIWFWIIIELINGVGHPIWAFMQKGYEPGVLTAPFLLVIAIKLLQLQLTKTR